MPLLRSHPMRKLSKTAECFTQLVEAGRGHVLRPLVAQSARELLENLVEAANPSEGIYYCLRNPDGWAPFPYRFDEYPRIDHATFWAEYIVPVLAMRWSRALNVPAKRLESGLELAAHGFPRGRVMRNVAGRYVVLHGDGMPRSIRRKTIDRLFSLPRDTKWEPDSEERCQVEQRDVIRGLLRLKETWAV